MGKLLVLADKHTQLVVVHADIFFHHVLRWLALIAYVVIHEVKHHIGVAHRGAPVAVFCKAVIVIPRFHQFYQFIGGVVELASSGIIIQHLAHILFRKSSQFIELDR